MREAVDLWANDDQTLVVLMLFLQGVCQKEVLSNTNPVQTGPIRAKSQELWTIMWNQKNKDWTELVEMLQGVRGQKLSCSLTADGGEDTYNKPAHIATTGMSTTTPRLNAIN